ncbi:MAG: magnesium/cobalt transporter CorA [Longimicrobiales bacterium]|nr:magnesium/cobalt transporter CorA [Longimicrobiales bacterium]
MPSYLRRRPRDVGAPPGTVTVSPDQTHPFVARFTRYDRRGHETGEIARGASPPEVRAGEVLWVDLVGHAEIEELSRIARHYGVSPLVIEDAVDIGQRPKLDLHHGAVFLSLRSISILPGVDDLRREQIGLYLRDGLVISFQEIEGDVWAPVRRRLADEGSQLRASGADRLWSALLDATVDAYYLVLDRIAEGIEEMEESIFDSLPADAPQRLRELRKEAVALRRAAWPLREALEELGRVADERFAPESRTLLDDVRDHVRQVAEVNELMREAITANLDTYLSLVGMRQNETMKVLTLVATIFIPLTFVAGIYGMNFEFMPELGYVYGYPIVWGVMIAMTLGMLRYFSKRGWL